MSKLANTVSKKEKKELTPKQQKTRLVLNWVVNIASIIIIVFALVYAILTIVRVTNANGVTSLFGKVYMNVLSDSMEPTFSEGDVIVAQEYKGDGTDLKVGQVITFKFDRTYKGQVFSSFNTHRIIQIEETSSGLTIRTRGDNQKNPDGSYQDWHDYIESQEGTQVDRRIYDMSDIVAVWGTVDDEYNFTPGKVLKGAGLFSNWLQDPIEGRTRFFLIIVLPLILLFVAYAFVLIRALILARVEKDKAVQADTTVTMDSLSDEEKRRLAEEYLASLAQKQAEPAPSEEPNAPQEPAADEEPAQAPEDAQKPSQEPVADDSDENSTETSK